MQLTRYLLFLLVLLSSSLSNALNYFPSWPDLASDQRRALRRKLTDYTRNRHDARIRAREIEKRYQEILKKTRPGQSTGKELLSIDIHATRESWVTLRNFMNQLDACKYGSPVWEAIEKVEGVSPSLVAIRTYGHRAFGGSLIRHGFYDSSEIDRKIPKLDKNQLRSNHPNSSYRFERNEFGGRQFHCANDRNEDLNLFFCHWDRSYIEDLTQYFRDKKPGSNRNSFFMLGLRSPPTFIFPPIEWNVRAIRLGTELHEKLSSISVHKTIQAGQRIYRTATSGLRHLSEGFAHPEQVADDLKRAGYQTCGDIP